MNINVVQGILIPFFGTAVGSACVVFMKKTLNAALQKALTGFAAGVMVAASIWSLLIPAMEQSKDMGVWAFVPAVAGFWIGIMFLLFLDRIISCFYYNNYNSCKTKGAGAEPKKTVMLVLAVTLHNIPEGMAVGVAFAGYLSQNTAITLAGAFALSIGIAIQNFPEGAIISMPLKAEGVKKMNAFLYGMLSGIVEPVAAILTILVSVLVIPLLPYFLSFAAGAMIYVVVVELIPEMPATKYPNLGTVFFTLGFTLMLALDVALG